MYAQSLSMVQFLERIHIHSALPIIAALVLIAIESVFLSLRLWVLIPSTHGIRRFDLMKLYYKSVLIAHLSYPTIADVYRFKVLQKLCPSDLLISERVEWIGIEKMSEPLTLFALGFLLVKGDDVYQYIPKKILLPFLALVLVVVAFLAYQKRRQKDRSRPRIISFRSAGIVVAFSALGWLLDLAALRMLTFEYSLSWSQLMLTMLAVAMTSVPPLPWGRWGLFEGVVSGALRTFGVPIEQGLFIATTFHVLMLVPVGGFYIYAWLIKRFR